MLVDDECLIYNEKCDLWSIGVMLFYWITGNKPFLGESYQEIFLNICTENP